MILKKSYWAKWLENNRRRSWTFLLCLVMALFCGPQYLMVVPVSYTHLECDQDTEGNLIGTEKDNAGKIQGESADCPANIDGGTKRVI